jgi:hypothetical protein
MTPATTMATESNGSCSTTVAPLDAGVVDAAVEADAADVASLVALLDTVELVLLEVDTGNSVSREIQKGALGRGAQTIRTCLRFEGLSHGLVFG